jgi:hypothetical protein
MSYFDYEACCTGIIRDYQSKYPGYNVMVFYSENSYSSNLEGAKPTEHAICNGYGYYVWVFESGTFENKGSRGYSNWCFLVITRKIQMEIML